MDGVGTRGVRMGWWGQRQGWWLGMGYRNKILGMWDGNRVEDMGLVQFGSFSAKGGVALTSPLFYLIF